AGAWGDLRGGQRVLRRWVRPSVHAPRVLAADARADRRGGHTSQRGDQRFGGGPAAVGGGASTGIVHGRSTFPGSLKGERYPGPTRRPPTMTPCARTIVTVSWKNVRPGTNSGAETTRLRASTGG